MPKVIEKQMLMNSLLGCSYYKDNTKFFSRISSLLLKVYLLDVFCQENFFFHSVYSLTVKIANMTNFKSEHLWSNGDPIVGM